MGRKINPEAVIELVPGLTKQKLAHMRFNRQGPPFYKPTTKTVVYDEDDILAWLESTRVQIGQN